MAGAGSYQNNINFQVEYAACLSSRTTP